MLRSAGLGNRVFFPDPQQRRTIPFSPPPGAANCIAALSALTHAGAQRDQPRAAGATQPVFSHQRVGTRTPHRLATGATVPAGTVGGCGPLN